MNLCVLLIKNFCCSVEKCKPINFRLFVAAVRMQYMYFVFVDDYPGTCYLYCDHDFMSVYFVCVRVFFEQKPPVCVCVLQLPVPSRDFTCMTLALGVVDPPEARRASNDVSVDDV